MRFLVAAFVGLVQVNGLLSLSSLDREDGPVNQPRDGFSTDNNYKGERVSWSLSKLENIQKLLNGEDLKDKSRNYLAEITRHPIRSMIDIRKSSNKVIKEAIEDFDKRDSEQQKLLIRYIINEKIAPFKAMLIDPANLDWMKETVQKGEASILEPNILDKVGKIWDSLKDRDLVNLS